MDLLEPNCDMPWEIYLDFLADQGFDDLRSLNPYSLVTPSTCIEDFLTHNRFSFGMPDSLLSTFDWTGEDADGIEIHTMMVSLGFDAEQRYLEFRIYYNFTVTGCG